MSPRNAAKGVKARRMWAYTGSLQAGDVVLREKKARHCTVRAKPVLVIPASPSDVVALREKIACCLADHEGLTQNSTWHPKKTGHSTFWAKADAVLAALGLTARTAQGRGE